jgi:hypothetical protein
MPPVLPCAALNAEALAAFVAHQGMQLTWVEEGQAIPGSYWGEPEAGIIGARLYVRRDTPVHSLLHELGHWRCMDPERRAIVDTDACGTDTEENAVCYLQALLADRIPGYSRERLLADMDAWGYHFILGSARAWFEQDSDDARGFLQRHGLLDADGALTGRLRLTP